MFSGIVETTGVIHALESTGDCMKLTIKPHLDFSDIRVGDSIAVNGVCLTVIHCQNKCFDVTVVPQTLRVTNLGALDLKTLVNLERSMKVDDRCGGHYVQGHVDGLGEIIEHQKDGEEALMVKISTNPSLAKYLVNKGYVAMDGMSLTIIEAHEHGFTVTLIPHTQQVTIAKNYALGTKVNIEVDILSKYVEKLIESNKYAIPSREC